MSAGDIEVLELKPFNNIFIFFSNTVYCLILQLFLISVIQQKSVLQIGTVRGTDHEYENFKN
jgi:hypothetical protein